jgi:outer membrane cobalamin receptor
MIADLRPLGAMTAGLLLVGCTAATVKPQPVAARNDPVCVTATRISSSAPCGAPGRVYSGQDIQNTGATTVAEALRLLDPSITVHR